MQITCSSCQRQLRVPDAAVGKSIRCPGCGTVFKAVAEEEGIQPAKAPVAKRPPPPPPPPQEEYEEVPPRRRRRDDEEDESDRPRRGRSDEDSDDEAPRARRRRRDEDDDEDEEDYKQDRKEARRRGKSAALWFLLAGITNLIFIALSLGSNLMIAAQLGGGVQAPRIAGMFGCGLVFVCGAVYQFTAGSALKSFEGKGRVITAIVFGFLFGVLTGIGALVNLALMSQVPGGFLSVLVLLAIVLGSATAFLNLFAAIKGIVTLNNRAVSRMFRR